MAFLLAARIPPGSVGGLSKSVVVRVGFKPAIDLLKFFQRFSFDFLRVKN
jgi:hypothetical protein